MNINIMPFWTVQWSVWLNCQQFCTSLGHCHNKSRTNLAELRAARATQTRNGPVANDLGAQCPDGHAN